MKCRTFQLRIPPRQGAIFVLSLAVIIILSGLVLVFAQEMRTEGMSSANRLSYVQAEAIEQGAEQWVLAQVESNAPDAVTVTQTDAEALQVGDGYFYILHPDPTQDQTYAYGITDEAGKIDLSNSNAVTPAIQFINLPGMTADIASSITDWQIPGGTLDPNGASDSYYQSLQEPYGCKGAAFESVEELLLIRNMTPQILYGYDLNHDGVLDANERSLAGMGAQFSIGNDTRGLFNYVTCFGLEPAALPGGSAVPSVSTPGMSGVLAVLSTVLSQSRATAIQAQLGGIGSFSSLAAFFQASGMTPTEIGEVAGQITSGASTKHPLNINTASEQALMCLPGLVQADADNIIAARTSADTSTASWFFTALSDPTKIAEVADYVTDLSYRYSADIVAVSGDGRAFKRVRIVVDVSQYPTTPAQIIYRKDLTSLGWPLPPEYRTSLRAGHGVPDASQAGALGLNGSGLKLGTTPN